MKVRQLIRDRIKRHKAVLADTPKENQGVYVDMIIRIRECDDNLKEMKQ